MGREVPTPGFDHRQVDGGGQQRRHPGQHQRAHPDVPGRDVVGQVDALGVRAPRRDDRVQRAHVLAARAVVGEERDHRAHDAHPTGAPASASSADTRPGIVCSAASAWTSIPSSRAVALVTGPIETTRGPAARRSALAIRVAQQPQEGAHGARRP